MAIVYDIAILICLFILPFPCLAGIVGMAIVAPNGIVSYLGAAIGLWFLLVGYALFPPLLLAVAVAYSLLWWGSGFSVRLDQQEFGANLLQSPPLLLQASWVTGLGFGIVVGLMWLLSGLAR